MEQRDECEILFAGNDNRGSIQKSPYTEISVPRPGWTRLLVLAGIATTLGCSMPAGYNIGVVNTPADIIKPFFNESLYTRFGVVLGLQQLSLLWSSIVSIFLVGGAVGSLGGSYLADRVGRKGAMVVGMALGVGAALLFDACKPANSVEMIIVGRLLAGLSAGLVTSVVPMYLTELSPLHLRGSMGVLCPLGVCFGVLVGQILSLYQILGNEDNWHHCLSIYGIATILCASIIPVIPESPKYLFVIKKQPQLALEVLSKIRSTTPDLLEHEIQELKIEEQDNLNQGESWSVVKILTSRSVLLPLLLVCSLQAGQQFSGINAVFYYSGDIFASAGLSRSNSQWATIGTGVCNLMMALFAIYSMSRFNRRLILQASLAAAAFFLVLLGLSITYMNAFTWMPYICILAVLCYVISYGLGLGPIPYFIGSELFEVGPRPAAMALGSMSNWGGNFIVGLCFPSMQVYIGPSSFYIFAGIVVLLFFFIRFYLPETRGRDASEVATLCSLGLSSRPLSSPTNSSSTSETYQACDDKYV